VDPFPLGLLSVSAGEKSSVRTAFVEEVGGGGLTVVVGRDDEVIVKMDETSNSLPGDSWTVLSPKKVDWFPADGERYSSPAEFSLSLRMRPLTDVVGLPPFPFPPRDSFGLDGLSQGVFKFGRPMRLLGVVDVSRVLSEKKNKTRIRLEDSILINNKTRPV